MIMCCQWRVKNISAFWETVSWVMKWNSHFDEVCSCLANGYRLPKGLVCSSNMVNIWCGLHCMHIIISNWLNCASHSSFRSTTQSRVELLQCSWLDSAIVFCTTFSPTGRRQGWWSRTTNCSGWRGTLTNTYLGVLFCFLVWEGRKKITAFFLLSSYLLFLTMPF